MKRRPLCCLLTCLATVLVLGIVPHVFDAAQASYRYGPVVDEPAESPHPYPTGEPGGSVVWWHEIVQPGAYELMITVANLDLGEGDTLVVSDSSGDVVWQLTSLNNGIALPSVRGDYARLELVSDDAYVGDGVTIDDYAYRDEPFDEARGDGKTQNLSCYTVPPASGGRCYSRDHWHCGRPVARLHLESVGITPTERYWCTGFLVDVGGREDILMTAEHCFNEYSRNDILKYAEFSADYPRPRHDPNCKMEGCPVDPTKTCSGWWFVLPIGPAACRRNPLKFEGGVWKGGEDWAIIRLANMWNPIGARWEHPGRVFGTLSPVAVEDFNKAAYIIEHPKGRCKEIDRGRSFGGSIGRVLRETDWCFDYDLDAWEKGSSGSPILADVDEAEKHKVIGVHFGSATGKFWTGGEKWGLRVRANKMSKILRTLSSAVKWLDKRPAGLPATCWFPTPPDTGPDPMGEPISLGSVRREPVSEPQIYTNRPNPFSSKTTICYSTPTDGHVGIRIYHVSGRLVRDLFSGHKSAGHHETVWNGQDNTGRPVGNGVYFTRMSTAGQEMVRKMIVVR